jgi:hypothetical protein
MFTSKFRLQAGHLLAANRSSHTCSSLWQLSDVVQRPALPLPETGEPSITLDGATFCWKAASEGGQPALLDVTLQVLPVAPTSLLLRKGHAV